MKLNVCLHLQMSAITQGGYVCWSYDKLCFSNFTFYLFQEKKGAKQRLYGKGKGQIETKDERQSPHRPQQSIINFDNFEASNKGKYEKIYPPNDKHLHEMYDIFLAGSNSAFQHSFDM